MHHISCKNCSMKSIYCRYFVFDVIQIGKGCNSVKQNAIATRALSLHSPGSIYQWISKDLSCDGLIDHQTLLKCCTRREHASYKGEKLLTSKYGLVAESPDILHCEIPTFTDFITSLIFKISWLLAEKSLFE